MSIVMDIFLLDILSTRLTCTNNVTVITVMQKDLYQIIVHNL